MTTRREEEEEKKEEEGGGGEGEGEGEGDAGRVLTFIHGWSTICSMVARSLTTKHPGLS